MTAALAQVHAKFKMFVGDLDPDKKPSRLMQEVEAFVEQAAIAPKSIGVEYLESARKVVLTLGYRDDEAGHKVSFQVTSLGKAADFAGESILGLEKALTRVAANTASIICHELYVTEENEFLVIFMTRR